MERVTITDVTLREYGQNIPSSSLHIFTPEIRIQVAQKLIRAGFSSIEVFSCVHPKVAPAMTQAAIRRIAFSLGRADSFKIITLVPNKVGYRNFLALGLGPDGYNHTMGVFFSSVEAHNILNLGRPISETMDEYRTIVGDAIARKTRVVGYVSAAFGYLDHKSGEVIRPRREALDRFIDFYFDLGVEAVTLSDLQGVADDRETAKTFETILGNRKSEDLGKLGYHPHHVSEEKALANSKVAYDLGIRRFDASLGGTGGCVTGAPGNQPSDTLVHLFENMGVETGVSLKETSALTVFVQDHLYARIPRRKKM